MVINNWTDHAPTENSGSIALNGGQHYDITMEYYEGGGGAIAKLLWSSATIAKQVVHQSVLYPPMSGTPSGIFELEPVHAPGMRLEVDNSSDSDGANVQLWGDYNGSSQRWQISPVSTGVVELAPLCATGRRLDVSGGANADGANVHLWTDNDSPAQRWQITEVAAGIYELSPLCAPGKVLDCYYSGTGNGTNVQIWSGGGGTNQRWRLLPP